MLTPEKTNVLLEACADAIMARNNIIDNLAGSNQALGEQCDLLRREVKKQKAANADISEEDCDKCSETPVAYGNTPTAYAGTCVQEDDE